MTMYIKNMKSMCSLLLQQTVQDQHIYSIVLRFCYIRVAKTVKYKGVFQFGTREITLLYNEIL